VNAEELRFTEVFQNVDSEWIFKIPGKNFEIVSCLLCIKKSETHAGSLLIRVDGILNPNSGNK